MTSAKPAADAHRTGRLKTLQLAVRNAVNRRLHPDHYLLQDKTAKTLLIKDGIFSVYAYQPLTDARVQVEDETLPVSSQTYQTPVILVPPLGVYAWIFDLMGERSLARYLMAKGFRVYLIDWGNPRSSESHLSLETYTLNWFPKAITAVQQHSGEKEVTLLGYCMGGLLSLIYTAAEGNSVVKNLVTIASPINMYHMVGPVGKITQLMSMPSALIKKYTGKHLKDIDPDWFHVEGRVLSVLFKLTQPQAIFSSYVDLVKNISNEHYVSRYMTMNEWFSNMPDYPGATVQEMMQKLGLANSLHGGEFRIGGRDISFKRIHSALLAFAGNRDVIATVSAASAIVSVVSSTDKTFEVVPGGHAGVFTGRSAVHTTWAIAADWLGLRSGKVSGLAGTDVASNGMDDEHSVERP